MDELEKQLRADADKVVVASTAELQARIDASLRSAREVRSVAAGPERRVRSTWWLSSLTGLAAAAAIILIFNWNSPTDSAAPAVVADAPLASEPQQAAAPWTSSGLTLQLENADLTRSLEQELVDLQADIERARKGVERDVRQAF